MLLSIYQRSQVQLGSQGQFATVRECRLGLSRTGMTAIRVVRRKRQSVFYLFTLTWQFITPGYYGAPLCVHRNYPGGFTAILVRDALLTTRKG